ncbi:hypothetical protein CAP36_13735 [Chitinophagaceae bacterium IBVUCB2]|nr:hypothetical protein CAP36_13735 [Chitinophagaceae bacterium IBVUCB2]
MNRITIVFFLLICLKSNAQSINYDSIHTELTRLFGSGNFKKAYKMADEVLPLLKDDKNRDDSIYSYILYIATMIYGLEKDYEKSVETLKPLERIVAKRFGEENMKYYGVLYLQSQYYSIKEDRPNRMKCNDRIQKILYKLLSQENNSFPGFEMIYNKADIRFNLSVSLESSAMSYMFTGKISEAEKYFKEAELFTDRDYILAHDPSSYIGRLFQYAYFMSYTERLEEAEAICNKALEWAKEAYNETHPSYAQTLWQVANFYSQMQDDKKAIGLLLQTKKILENSLQKSSFAYLTTVCFLSNLYMDTDNLPMASNMLKVIQMVAPKNAQLDKTNWLFCMFPQIRLMLLKNNFSEADSLLNKVHPYCADWQTEITNANQQYIILRIMYHSQLKQFKEADLYYSGLMQHEIQNTGTKSKSYSFAVMKKAHNYLKWGIYDSANAYILKGAGSMTEVLKKNFPFFSDNQRQNYLSHSESLFHMLYNISSVIGSEELITTSYNSQLLLKGLLLKTSVLSNRQLKWKDSVQQQQFYEYVNIRKTIIEQSGKSSTSQKELEELKKQEELLEKKLSKYSRTIIDQQFKSKTFTDISAALQKGEAALEFINYTASDTNWLAALIINAHNKKPQIIKLCRENELEKLLASKSINHEATINLIYKGEISKSIYRLIWKPLEQQLSSVQKIYFAASGLLHQISLAALRTEDDELLSDRYELSKVNTTSYITNQHQHIISTSDKIILYGGIDYTADSTDLKKVARTYNTSKMISRALPDELERSGGFPYLPATQTEVTEILEMGKPLKISIEVRKGIEASEESIKSLDGNASPAILHIASHGFFFPDPKKQKKDVVYENQRGSNIFKQSDNPLFRAGLAFAGAELAWKGKAATDIDDGILTAYEISNMYLPNTWLVVLSACETGLGDINGTEGVYGLQRSFNMAGVQNLVMSLWKVPDVESAEFMTLLYKNIFKGEPIDEAFRNTQTTMKNKYRNEPYKWAAWILVR